MPNFKRLLLVLFCTAICLFGLTACRKGEEEIQGEPLDFTVLTQEEIPAQLLKVVEGHKTEEIAMSYKIENDLYIVRGYGQQDTGGCSIAVNACVLAEDGIHVDFSLIGPQTEETAAQGPSCPYVVLKLEYRDVQVFFD